MEGFFFAVPFALLAAYLVGCVSRPRNPGPGRCRVCGYSTLDLPDPSRCPECGKDPVAPPPPVRPRDEWIVRGVPVVLVLLPTPMVLMLPPEAMPWGLLAAGVSLGIALLSWVGLRAAVPEGSPRTMLVPVMLVKLPAWIINALGLAATFDAIRDTTGEPSFSLEFLGVAWVVGAVFSVIVGIAILLLAGIRVVWRAVVMGQELPRPPKHEEPGR